MEKLKIINFETFRPLIEKALKKERKSNAGRRPFNVTMMFKILILQRLFNLSDDQTEYQITDRMSFQRFLGLSLGERVPDAKTIWLFRNQLTESGIIEELFIAFNKLLTKESIITHTGTIIDATFVDAPRQHNSRKENQQIKEGNIPEEWENKPSKLAQKDTDARWTKKNDEKHYGYKDHVKVDADSKVITDYAVTAANVHDSNEFTNFLNEKDNAVYADSAYVGKPIPGHIENHVCEKGYRGKPLTEEQKQNNRHRPEGHPTPSFREDRTHRTESAKRLCAFLCENKLELTDIVIEHIPTTLNTSRNCLNERVIDVCIIVGCNAWTQSDADCRVCFHYKSSFH